MVRKATRFDIKFIEIMIDNQNLHFNVNGFCAISASILSFRFAEKNYKQTTISVCFAFFFENSSRFTTFEIEKVDEWKPKKKIFLTDKSKSVASVLPKSRKTLKWRPSSSKKLEG